MALMLPWLAFLFVGAFDWGYYAHALISTEAAARTAGTYAATNSTDATDTTNVCLFALEELRIVPNIGASTTCNGLSPRTSRSHNSPSRVRGRRGGPALAPPWRARSFRGSAACRSRPRA